MSQYNLKINGKEYNVCVDSVKGDHAEVTVNGKKYEVEIARPKPQIEIPSRPSSAASEDPVPFRRPSRKKAIVTLSADSKTIDFFEGMV